MIKKLLDKLGSSYAFVALESVALVILLTILFVRNITLPESVMAGDGAEAAGAEEHILSAEAGNDMLTEEDELIIIPDDASAVPVGSPSGPGFNVPAGTPAGTFVGMPGAIPYDPDDEEYDPDQDEDTEDEVESLMDSMTVEDKTAQLMIVTLDGLTGSSGTVVAGRTVTAALEACHAGGIVITSANRIDERQTRLLTDSLARIAEEEYGIVPLIISDGPETVSLSELMAADPDDGSAIICVSIAAEGQASTEELAVTAVIEGADMIYVTDSPEKVYVRLLSAVYDGEIADDRLDDAVCKILNDKLSKETR